MNPYVVRSGYVGTAMVLAMLLGQAPGWCGQAEDVANRILAAHGGGDAWQAAPTISMDHELIFDGQGKPWLSVDVVDRKTRRVYQDWPNHDAQIVWDGKDVWSVNWKLPNPPKVMPFLTFNTITTPWLLLLEEATVTSTGREKLPGDDKEYVTVTLRVEQDPSRPPVASYYKMYADPTSYRLRGVAYAVNYGALLDAMGIPPGVEEVGPMIHVFDEWTEVDGLTLPSKYHTVGANGALYGKHTVRNWSLSKKFDEKRMKRPEGAVVDKSSHLRAAAE